MRTFFLTLCFIISSNFGLGQRVGTKPPVFGIDNFNSMTSDGILTFELDCRMADCVATVQIIDIEKIKKKKSLWDYIYDWWWFKVVKRFDFQTAKVFSQEITADDYFLKDLDDGQEHIYMKCQLITLKSLFGRKSIKKRIRINVYSLSGKKIYTKDFTLDKYKLIESLEN